MNHVVLLGDSIFDNKSYAIPGSPVIDWLRENLDEGQATLRAVDGATTADIPAQCQRLPPDATHLVLSVGGNNALGESHRLLGGSASTLETMATIANVRNQFLTDYRAVVCRLANLQLPVVLSTVYDSIPDMTDLEKAGLALFNEVILREAARAHFPVLDLQLLCSDPQDYSRLSSIEPSDQGGRKIARAIARIIRDHEFPNDGCRIYW